MLKKRKSSSPPEIALPYFLFLPPCPSVRLLLDSGRMMLGRTKKANTDSNTTWETMVPPPLQEF